MDTTTKTDEQKQDKVLDLVAALLARAEHPNTPAPEAELALMQANKLIAKHAIDEALLRQSQTVGERRALIRREVQIGGGYTFGSRLKTIFHYAAQANRVSVAFLQNGVAVCFGAEEDVAWLDMLYSMIRLQFLSKIDPKWDPAKSFDENVYNLKVAGNKWADIDAESRRNGGPDNRLVEKHVFAEGGYIGWYWESQIDKGNAWWSDDEDNTLLVASDTKLSGKLITAYKRWARMVGDTAPVTTQSHRAYKNSYAEAFTSRMAIRFLDMKRDAEETGDTIEGAALAIRDLKDEANRMMWDEFPTLSPEAAAERQARFMKQQQEADAAEQARLDAMTPKQREAHFEKIERQRRREDAAYWRNLDKGPKHDGGARSRGEAAANAVDLSRKAGHADRGTSRGELG